MSTTQLPAPQSSACRGSALNVASGSASPTDVQLTTMSAASGRLDGARAELLGQRAGPLGRAVPDLHVGRSGLHRARRRRPARHRPRPARARVRPAGSGASRAREQAGRSRCCRPRSRRPRTSACSRRRSPAPPRWRSSASASAASLCGIVTLTPRKPGGGQRAHGLGEQLGRQRQLQVAPAVEARAPRAPRCASRASASARPASRTRPGGSRDQRPSARARPGSARRRAGTARRSSENACSPDCPRLAHVEEVVLAARRVGGGLDRGQAGVADRRRRQAAVQARVVRARRARARTRAAGASSCSRSSGSWRRCPSVMPSLSRL